MRLILLAALTLALLPTAAAQTRADWTRAHDSGSGAWATDVARDAAGNLYVTGYTSNTGADFDGDGANDVPCSAYVVSYDAGGALRWSTPLVARSAGEDFGITCPDEGLSRAIAVTPGGDVFAIGNVEIYRLYAYHNEQLYTSPPQGQTTSYLARLDGATGAVTDFRHYGGYSQSYNVVTDIATDEDGRVYLSGYGAGAMDIDGRPGVEISYSAGPTGATGYFSQYDADLDLQRFRFTGRYFSPCRNGIDNCSYSYNSIQSIDVRGGKIALGGSFVYGVHFRGDEGTVPFSLYNTDPFIDGQRVSDAYAAVYDTAFVFQWARGVHGADSNVSEAIALGPDGSVYHGSRWYEAYALTPGGAALYASATGNDADQSALTRFDADGSYAWTVPYYTPSATSEDPRMETRIFDIDASGDLVVVGGEIRSRGGGAATLTDYDISGDGKPELRDALSYRANGRGFAGGYSPTSGNLVWHAFPGGMNNWAGRPGLTSASVRGVLHAPGGAILVGDYQGQALDVNTDGTPEAPRARNQNGGFATKINRITEPETGPSRALSVRDPRGAVEIAHDDALNLAAGGGLTVEAWYRREATRVFRYDSGPFVWKGSTWVGSTSATFYHSSKTSPFALGMGFSGAFRASIGDGTDADVLDSTTRVAFDGTGANADTTWHHVALTADGTAVRLYVDGVMEASVAQTVTVAGNTRPLFLGGMTPIGGSHANQDIGGQIDGVRLWSRALSAEELAARRHLRLDASDEAGLVAYYDFDAGHAPSIRDRSGGGHDGWLSPWATLPKSTAPIGTGVVAAADVTEETPTPLAGTDLAVGLVGASGTPRMQAVRLGQPPEGEQPSGVDDVVPTTWVIDNVGGGSFGSANLAFTVGGLRPGADAGSFALFRRPSGSEGPWEQVAASATSFDDATGTIRFDGVACCSQYAIGAGAGALPVELASFSAAVDGDAALLAWTTSSETNNDGFMVEMRNPEFGSRNEDAGGAWREVGFVAGAGTTLEAQAYSFEVAGLAPGAHRFRLKQIDYDGAQSYSSILEVAIGMDEATRIGAPYPNPASGAASLSVAVRAAQTVEVTVYDVLGREVARAARLDLGAAETRVVALPVTDLAAGLYMVRVEGETFAQARRLTLVR